MSLHRPLVFVSSALSAAGIVAVTGTPGDDTLRGTPGDDLLEGGPGDDLYVVNSPGDRVVERPGEGFDTALVELNFWLKGPGLEVARLAGVASHLAGRDDEGETLVANPIIPSVLLGGGGDDALWSERSGARLEGGAGDDVLRAHEGSRNGTLLEGGAGDDQYVVWDGRWDEVTERAGEGTDTVWVGAARYTLPDHVEVARQMGGGRLLTGNAGGNTLAHAGDGWGTLDGAGGDDNLWGGDLGGHLIGGAGDDILRGGRGPWATLEGGSGNDQFVVNHERTLVLEGPSGGLDTAWVAADGWTSAAHVEVVYLSGSARRVTGSANSEQLVANPALGSTLDGWDGADILWGSPFADHLIGAAGDDILRGQGGADTLEGGWGNDQYVVLDARSVVVEEPLPAPFDEQIPNYDIVYFDGVGGFALPERVEDGRLFGVGTALEGNGLRNLLVGNSGGIASTLLAGGGDDVVFGTAAGDTIAGGEGNDTLYAGGGADVILLDAAPGGLDLISGLDLAAGAKLRFAAASGVASFGDLTLVEAEGNTQVGWAGGNAVLLFGVVGMAAGDFLFG